MEPVHSSMYKAEPIIWEFALNKMIDSGTEFLRYFEAAFIKNNTLPSLTQRNAERVFDIFDGLCKIYLKFKKALIYTRYSLKNSDIEKLNGIIKKLQNHLSKTNSCNSIKKVGPDSIINQKQTDMLEAKYSHIKSIAVECINQAKDKILFTDKSWPAKSVLIGALRNSKQLQIALEHEFYHVPKAVLEDPQNIKCIAIYQSKNLFDQNAGVKYYGKVITYNEVARYEIKEIPSSSKDMYYRFEIEEWRMLKTPIKADALGEVATRTTLYQLLCAEKTSELHLDSKEEYEFFDFMKSVAFTPYPSHTFCRNVSLVYDGDVFEVYDRDMLKIKFTSEDFYKSGVIRAKQISALLQPILD